MVYLFFKSDSRASTRNSTKQTLAIKAAVPASDPKPRTAAFRAMTTKAMVELEA
jgi:hypothetical protein